MRLDIEALRLTGAEHLLMDGLPDSAQRDRNLADAQLAKVAWGLHTWMVLLGNGMIEADPVFAGNLFNVTTALGEALGQANVKRPADVGVS